MTPDPFEQMQKAVDVVNDSHHPTNKVAATLFTTDKGGKVLSHSCTNYWPRPIRDAFGASDRIGNSSGTVHAETECVLSSPFPTEGASLCVTDPLCPNCAKNIAEAGIKAIYIDHKGFAKDFAERRGGAFDSMSMRICERAGISVYEINRRERTLTPILEFGAEYKPYDESPVEIETLKNGSEALFRDFVALKRQEHRGRKIAVAIARNRDIGFFGMAARAHPALGYSMERDAAEIEAAQGQKYRFMLEPLNRLLMTAPRKGLKIQDGLVFSSGVPTARELVNFVGEGLSRICIGDRHKGRDGESFEAMALMSKRKIITFNEF